MCVCVWRSGGGAGFLDGVNRALCVCVREASGGKKEVPVPNVGGGGGGGAYLGHSHRDK